MSKALSYDALSMEAQALARAHTLALERATMRLRLARAREVIKAHGLHAVINNQSIPILYRGLCRLRRLESMPVHHLEDVIRGNLCEFSADGSRFRYGNLIL